MSERIARVEAEIELHPADADLRMQMAGLQCEHEEWQAVLTQLARADKLAPGKYETDLLRAQACLGMGWPAGAKIAMDRFLVAHPDSSAGLLWRARAKKALGETESSLKDYRATLNTAQPVEQDVFQEAADALAAAGHTDEAIAVLDAAIAKSVATPPLVLRAIDFEIAVGRVDAALARVDAMQKTAPRAEPWMATRARVLARAGRQSNAIAAWQALSAHLASLPPAQRSSHAMSMLAEQAQQALAAQLTLSPSVTDSIPFNTASLKP